jgi:peptidyl-prolyl cis-trans isomerase SurA
MNTFVKLGARFLISYLLLIIFPYLAFAEESYLNDKILIDAVVATVDNEPITLSDLQNLAGNKIEITLNSLKSDNQAEIALKEAISRKIIEIEAKSLKLSVTKAEIDSQIQLIAEKNNLSQEDFYQIIENEGQDVATFRNDLKKQILRSKVLGHYLRKEVIVSKEEIDRKITEKYNLSEESEQKDDKLLLRRIVINKAGKSPEKLKSFLDDLNRDIRLHKDFQSLVSKYSESPEKENGGSLGSIKWEDLNQDLAKFLKKQNKGKISKVWEDPNSYQFFVIDEGGKELINNREVRERVSEELKQDKGRNLIEDLIKREIPAKHLIEEKFNDKS